MKIAFIKRNFSYHGGAEKYLATLINQLKKEGHEIHIFSNKWQANEGVIFHKINILSFSSFLKAYTFNRNLNISFKEFPCIVSFERTTCQHIYRAGEGCHVKWLELRSLIEPFYKQITLKMNPLHRYYLRIEKEIFEKTPLIIANSNMVKSEILYYYGIDDNKITVIYNGVDTKKFSPKNKHELREKYNLPKDLTIILFVGSGFKRKGLDTLIKAFARLKEQNLLLIVIGKGDKIEYEKTCHKLKIEKKVLFLGIRKDIESFYALSDLFVLPTIYDPFSNATLEAMASGIPVITTKNNGVAELIEDGKEGYLTESINDYEELSNKITLALKDTEFFGKNARKKAEKFNIEKMTTEFTECIKEFL